MNAVKKQFLFDIHEQIYQIAKNDADLTQKLQKLAFGILSDIDGESAYLSPFSLIPISDDEEQNENIAGNLHNEFYEIIK